MTILSKSSTGGAALTGTNTWTGQQSFTVYPVKHTHGIISDGVGNGSTTGNARGTGSSDFATKRSNANQVASGNYSVLFGEDCRIDTNCDNSVVGGKSNSSISTGGGSFSYYNTIFGNGNSITNANGATIFGQNNSVGAGALNSFIVGTGSTVTAAAGGKSQYALGEFIATSADYAMGIGLYSAPTRHAQFTLSGGRFTATGDAQTSILVARKQTTNDTPTELALNGAATYLTITSDTAYLVEISLIGRKTTANTNGAYTWVGVIVNDGGTTSILGSPTVTVVHEDDAAWNFAVTADNTNDRLAMTVTGVAATTINWVATIRMTEVKA